MTIKIKSIPHKYRNKYLRDGSSSGAIIGSSGGGSSVSTGGSGLPYTLDDDGNYVIAKKITVQGDIYADTNIVASGEVSAWGAGSSSSGGTGTTGGGYWGEIQGTITNQTDLINYIDGKVSEGGGLTSVSWSDIQNKPSTYNPSSHGHAIGDITSLQSALDGKSSTAHTHSDKLDVTTFTAHTANTTSHITPTERSNWNGAVANNHTHSNKSVLDSITSANISSWNNKLDKSVWDKVFYFDSNDNLKVKLNLIGEKEVAAWGAGDLGGSGAITIVDGLTSTSTDAALSANQGRVLKSLIDNFEGGITSVSWSDVLNKPTSFTPSAHGHAISDITNLQSTLDGKSSSAHTHSNIVPIGEYSFDSSTLPNSLPSGVSNGFVNQNSGYGSYGSVLNVRSYAGGGGTLQLWTPYSPTYGGTSLKWRSGNYDSNNGNSWTGLKTILDSGNYNNYSPTKTGGGASGTWGINVSGNATSSSYPQGFTTKSSGGWGTIGTIGTLVTDWGTSTGGDIQFRERSGQLYVGVDGTFYQREGAYEVIDTSTINNYAATVNHTHYYAGSSSIGGSANSAVKLATPRTISIAGIATGSTSFDGSANVTINTTLNAESVKNTLKNEFKTLNLNSLNADTWYPCTLYVNPYGRTKIIFKNALQGNKPSWATHGSGFSLYIEWDVNGNGWGTTSEHRNIYGYTYSFVNTSPCGGITQNTMGNTEIIWLRGGGIYYYWTDNNSNFTINSNGYSWVSGSYTYSAATRTASQITDPLDARNGTIAASTFRGNLNGNADSTTQLQAARTLWGQSFNGTTNVSGDMNNVGMINFPNNVGGLQGMCGDNDYYRIIGRSTASNAGYMEIATADDGTEPIYVRQYTGVFTSLTRTATLLDGAGNTSFPGSTTSNTFYANNWFRSNSATGWFNESYGGGIYMTDSTYVRVYNGKSFYCPSNILAAGEVTAYSDRRLKSNIKPLENRGTLNPVTYEKNGKESIGFIAQEVQELYPELVSTDDSTDEKYLSLNYAQLTAVLAAQINDLRKELDELKAKLN